MQTSSVIKKFVWLVALLLLVLLLAPAAPRTHAATRGVGVLPNAPTHAVTRVQTDWGKMPLYFIANQGQMDARVAFYVQGSDKTLYFTPDGVTFALTDERRVTKDEGLAAEDEGRTTKGRFSNP
jgi:hypothetical protein